MKIKVRFFALHRDIVGASVIDLDVPEQLTLGQLWAQLGEQYPALLAATRSIMYARNDSYADSDTLIEDGDEVAFIPPVSGGSDLPLFAISDRPLNGEALQRLVQTPADGAVVLFSGVVRNNFAGRETAFLQYEAYESMAVPVLRQLAEEARQRWQIGKVAVHHRVGRLEIGETAVVVAVAAPHRGAAFAAAAYIMDRIKEVAPIWKREHWADGATEWVGNEKERTGESAAGDQ